MTKNLSRQEEIDQYLIRVRLDVKQGQELREAMEQFALKSIDPWVRSQGTSILRRHVIARDNLLREQKTGKGIET